MNNSITSKNNFISNIFIYIFYYVVFEGIFRKWITPGLNLQIILIRDVIVIFAIILGFTGKYFDFKSYLEKSLFFLTFIVLFWMIIQSIFNNLYIGILLIGFRNWIVYFWFAVLIYRTFEILDLYKFSKNICYTMFPISILVYFQYHLPPEHFLNMQTGSEGVYLVVDGIVRTTGTFTFTSGYSQYIAFSTPFVLYVLFDSKKKRSTTLKVILLTSFITSNLYSGSRELLWSSLAMTFFAFFINNSNKNFIIRFLIYGMITYLTSQIFAEPISAIMERMESASRAQSSSERILDMLLGEPNMMTGQSVWSTFSFFGKGIGLGSNLSKIFTGQIFVLGEYESTRIINEGGFMGVLFLFSKYIFSFFAVYKAAKIYKKYAVILPLYFSLFFATQLLLRNITGQLTGHAFTALGLGFIIYLLNKKYEHAEENNFAKNG